MHVRLRPPAAGAQASARDDDWIIRGVDDSDVIELENLLTGHRVVMGLDSVKTFQRDPARDTATTKYGFLQLLVRVQLGEGQGTDIEPLPFDRVGHTTPDLHPSRSTPLPPVAYIGPTASELAAELAKRFSAPSRTGRQLSEWQKVMLTGVLSQHPGTKILILVSRGDDTLAYANDFREVLLAANWKPEGPKLAPPDLLVMDVRLAADNAGTPRPAVSNFLAALKTAQIKCAQRYVLDEHIARDSMVVWVGSQSPEGWGPEVIAPIGVPKEYWTRPDGPPEPGDISRPVIAPAVQQQPTTPPAQPSAHEPRLVVEQARVNTPAKAFGGAKNQIIARLVSYASMIVKNDPLSAGREGVAKNVTAHAVFSNSSGAHHLTVQTVWDKERELQAPPKVTDNFTGGGPSVWFDVGQRRALILAFKFVEAETAYALTVQPNVHELEVEAPGLAIPPGEYGVVVEVRSGASSIRENFSLILNNPGKGAPLTLRLG